MHSRLASAVLLSLGLPLISQAQEPPPVAPTPPAPGAPNGQQFGQRDKEGRYIVGFHEEFAQGKDMAEFYLEYTGRRLIVTSAAADARGFTFSQPASVKNPLSADQVAELLRKQAVLEGYVFTQHPDDPNLEILTVVTGGQPRPTNVNVDTYNEGKPLPEGDGVVTYVMTFNYIKPDQAAQIFTQIIGQLGAYGQISAVPNASAVVITEKASLIKSLVELKKTIDVPGSVQATRFVQVEFADVTEVAAVLNELMSAQQTAQQTAGVQRAPAVGAEGAVPAAGADGGSAGVSTPVQIVADARTNRIFAMGRPVDLVFVENLVRQFDIPTNEKTFLRRKLRFLTVSEFLPVAGDALTRAFTGTGDAGAAAGAQPATAPQSRARQTTTPQRGMSSQNSFQGGNSSFGNNSFGNNSFGSGGGGGSVSLGDPEVSAAPESLLVGRTLLVADNITNSIVVQGPPSALVIVERLLEQLDVKPQQVMISTVIGQLTLDKSKELGFNYLLKADDVRAGGGGTDFNVLDPVNPGDFPVFNPASLAASGLRAYGRVGDLSAYIRALSSKTDFTVLSRPSIFTSNNQKGVISSGEQIAVPTQGGTSTGAYASGTAIQYMPVELKLEVIPLVNSDNEITMQIALKNDEQNGEQIIQGAGTNGGDLTVPRISTREILTTATVPNNETIVLGGLIVGRTDKQKSGIPILSDIPLIGALFSSNSNSESRSELLVFIQPSVIGNEAGALDAMQQDMDRRFSVSGNARDFADGPKLPGDEVEKPKPKPKRPNFGGPHR